MTTTIRLIAGENGVIVELQPPVGPTRTILCASIERAAEKLSAIALQHPPMLPADQQAALMRQNAEIGVRQQLANQAALAALAAAPVAPVPNGAAAAPPPSETGAAPGLVQH